MMSERLGHWSALPFKLRAMALGCGLLGLHFAVPSATALPVVDPKPLLCSVETSVDLWIQDLNGGDPSKADTAAYRLIRMQWYSDKVRDALIRTVIRQDKPVPMRLQIIEGLSYNACEPVASVLGALCGNANENIRLAALRGLGHQGRF